MALSANDAFSAGGRRSRRRRGRRSALSEINVTPLVDVMLVLLIIFMISAPLLTVGVPVELPKTEAGALDEQSEPLTISIKSDGAIFVQEEPVSYPELAARVQTVAAQGPDKPIYVRADGKAPYEKVAQVMAVLSTNGLSKIGLLTDTGDPAAATANSVEAPGGGARPLTRAVARPTTDFKPALAGAVLLHLAVMAMALFTWPNNKPMVNNGVTTVTIVDAPAAELRPAAPAPEPTPAATETPVPDAAPETPAPQPAPPAPPPPPKAAAIPKPTPTPTPPKPAPTPTPQKAIKPAPTPTPQKPAKAQATAAAKPAKPEPDFLESLTKSLAPSTKAGGGRSSAPKGPNRPETAPAARDGRGNAASALADAGALVGARLQRAWNPNCDVEGAGSVVVSVEFNLGPNGELVGQPRILNGQSGAVWQAAADRALRAVSAASPFPELPRESYNQWKVFRANFRGDVACR